jgi:glycosyltransferase involved in cell wall biosynthesis
MKILVIGNRIPWPIKDGGAMASYQLLKGYADSGAEVCFVTLNTRKHYLPEAEQKKALPFCEVLTIDHNADLSAWQALRNLLSPRSYFLERYHNPKALGTLFERVEWADWVQVEGLYSMPLARGLKQLKPSVRLVYRAHNVEYQIWSRLAQSGISWIKKIYLTIQTRRLKREEELAWKEVDAILPISQSDAETMAQVSPNVPIHTLLPGVNARLLEPIQIAPDCVCHLGSMEWLANREALAWFLQRVWPKVLAERPQAQFHIAGKGLSKSDPAYFQMGVVNHGEVDSSDDFLRNYGLLVVPIRAGSGIRMKTLEALSLGVPVVSTSVGAQGLSLVAEKEIYLADEPSLMATRLLELMENRKKAIDLAENGRIAVAQRYQLGPNIQSAIAFLSGLG